MSTCTLIGDAVAIGLWLLNSHCQIHAKFNPSSVYVAQHITTAQTDFQVISIGGNNTHDQYLIQDLYTIRKSMRGIVIWVVPVDKFTASQVHKVATASKDKQIKFKYKPDSIHPTSYGVLWNDINKAVTKEQQKEQKK